MQSHCCSRITLGPWLCKCGALVGVIFSAGCMLDYQRVTVETREVQEPVTEEAALEPTTNSNEVATNVSTAATTPPAPSWSSFDPALSTLLRTDANDLDFDALGIALPVLDSDSGLISSPALPAPMIPDDVTWVSQAQDPGSIDPAWVRELGVLQVHDFVVSEGLTLTLSGSRPLVIIASGTIRIKGIIDASASRDIAGNGAYAGSGAPLTGILAEGPGAASVDSDGGAGGGYFTAGGNNDESAGAGAAVNLSAPTPLLGGSGGAVYVGGSNTAGRGGAGGGAVYLYAQEGIEIGIDGGDPTQSGINVGGGGGDSSGSNNSKGAGGGSGGTLVLDAPSIVVHGTLAANGGSGGSWRGDGNDARFSATPAPGSTYGGGKGGDGGTGDLPAGDAESGSGAGGGSVGRIFVYAREAVSWGAGSVVSPSIASGGTTVTLTP